MNGTNRSGLRPDKLAVMVTNIESQGDLEMSWPGSYSPNSSEERLTTQHPPLPRELKVGVHRTFEVTRTAVNGDDSNGSQLNATEHV